MSFEKQERRRFGRRETNWAGRILLANGRTVRCSVKDCSVGGALIQLFEPTHLPFRFTLEVEGSGFRSECEVRHHRDLRVGVEFIRLDAEVRSDLRDPIARGVDYTMPPPVVRPSMRCDELRALVRRT